MGEKELDGPDANLSLERVPITGRLRFMDCSPEQEAEVSNRTTSLT